MTYTPLKIEIIKKFGRKDLIEGCLVHFLDTETIYKWKGYEDWSRKHDNYRMDSTFWDNNTADGFFEILGHLPHLEDIFRVAEEKGGKIWVSDVNKIEGAIRGYSIVFIKPYESWLIPYSPTLPLIEQDESTLSQLLSLFK